MFSSAYITPLFCCITSSASAAPEARPSGCVLSRGAIAFFHASNRVPSKRDDPRNAIKATQPRIPNMFSNMTLCPALRATNQLEIHTVSNSRQILRFTRRGCGIDGRNITQKPLIASERNAHVIDSVILFDHITLRLTGREHARARPSSSRMTCQVLPRGWEKEGCDSEQPAPKQETTG
jgi:hypothetical protein